MKPIVWRAILSIIVIEDKEHVLVTLNCPGEKHQYIVERKWFWHRRSTEMRCAQCEKEHEHGGGESE